MSDDRDQIREILSSVGIIGDELEWMTASCPSIAHAIDESDRRMGKIEPVYTTQPEPLTTTAQALLVGCRKCGAYRGRQCLDMPLNEAHVQRIRDSLEAW